MNVKNSNNKTLDHVRTDFILVCFLSFLACFYVNISLANGSDADPFPTIEIPIFHGGYHVKEMFDRSKGMKSVTYRVQANYPATEVLEFYDTYFNGSGWRLSYEICQRQWECFTDETIKGQPTVRQLSYSWEHPEFDLKIFLWLRYEEFDKEKSDEVIVKFQLQPKLDTSKNE